MESDERTGVRLQKYMAICGVASRRRSEELIAQGKVAINGEIVIQPYVMVDPIKDTVTVDGRRISLKTDKVYILLNKPRGVITTADDPFRRDTVLSIIGLKNIRVYPVGRLDFDTEGLLILTNDGELTYKLTHPKSQIEKEYYAKIKGRPSPDMVERLRRGVDIGGYVTAPAIIDEVKKENADTVYRVIIKEGKKRQIRRMFDSIGHPVLFLRRERIGDIVLGNLKPGQWRYLSLKETEKLK